MKSHMFHFHFNSLKQWILVIIVVILLKVAVIYTYLNGEDENNNILKFPHGKTYKNKNMTSTWEIKIEQRMIERRKYLNQKCSELKLDSPDNEFLHSPNPNRYLVNYDYHLIWCHAFQSATSSWLYNFNILAGYSAKNLRMEVDNVYELAKKKYPRVSLDELKNAQKSSITFLIARHPFERFFSAYRDKFKFDSTGGYYSRLVKKYRNMNRSRETISFKNFVTWFLEVVQSGGKVDKHLMSITNYCSPCLIDSDLIVKFETLKEDQIYLVENTGIDRVIKPEMINNAAGQSNSHILESYFMDLSHEQIEGLFNYYRNDFEIFGYDVKPFFDLRKKENSNIITTNAA